MIGPVRSSLVLLMEASRWPLKIGGLLKRCHRGLVAGVPTKHVALQRQQTPGVNHPPNPDPRFHLRSTRLTGTCDQ
jgi:hypothetical protein